MLRLNLTLPTPAENLALDEALLDWAEEGQVAREFLRVWESPEPIVVVGRSSRLHQEVDELACREHHIAVLRRSSGGAAIVAGPGCLMYAVVLSLHLRPELKDIRHAHTFVLGRLANALQPLLSTTHSVHCQGTSDLVIESHGSQTDCSIHSPLKKGDRHAHDIRNSRRSRNWPRASPLFQPAVNGPYASSIEAPRKFSGNSMRAKRTHMLYHGTLMYNFDTALIETCLRMPPRQPGYRSGRSHTEFVTNLPLSRHAIVSAIDSAWPTTGSLDNWPRARVDELVLQRFSQERWNHEFV